MKIPPLKCPQCQSTSVYKEKDLIVCDDCSRGTVPGTKSVWKKIPNINRIIGWTKKRDYPEGFFE